MPMTWLDAVIMIAAAVLLFGYAGDLIARLM